MSSVSYLEALDLEAEKMSDKTHLRMWFVWSASLSSGYNQVAPQPESGPLHGHHSVLRFPLLREAGRGRARPCWF